MFLLYLKRQAWITIVKLDNACCSPCTWVGFLFCFPDLRKSLLLILKKEKNNSKKFTTVLICDLLFHFLENQCTAFKINRSFSLERYTICLKTQEVSDIFLSSSYDGIVTFPPVYPLDFSRASVGYSKAVE